AGVDFISIAPQQPVAAPDGSVSTVATQITIDGGFFSLDRFLSLLETLPRAVKVTQIQVGRGATAGGLSLVISSEFYTTDSSAGPGSIPGPTNAGGSVPVPIPSASASASPSPSPGG